MKLLLVTFELSTASRVLAWQAKLSRALAARCEHVIALTESLGAFDPPSNLTVVPFPRFALNPLRLAGSAFILNPRVYRLCRQHRIDVCLVHMAAQWAYRLHPALRLAGVPTLLWYAHGTVSYRLRAAHACATRVVTSSPEGFRLPSTKLRIIGQGIDTDTFRVPVDREALPEVVYVGRVSPRKRLDLVLRSFARARALAPEEELSLRVFGPCLNRSDERYLDELRRLGQSLGIARHVRWMGHRPQADTAAAYRTAALHLNLSETGSMDKTVLEALACGCPVLTNNPAFRTVLRPFPGMYVDERDPAALAGSVVDLYRRRSAFPPERLRQAVVRAHGFDAYVDKIMSELTDLVRSTRR